MRLRHGTFLTTLGTVVLIPVIARTQQAISILYTATVLNYKGVPVTKPDVHIAGAIIEFDTSKGTHIKASCRYGPLSDETHIHLNPGDNELLVAVTEYNGGWAFECELSPIRPE